MTLFWGSKNTRWCGGPREAPGNESASFHSFLSVNVRLHKITMPARPERDLCRKSHVIQQEDQICWLTTRLQAGHKPHGCVLSNRKHRCQPDTCATCDTWPVQTPSLLMDRYVLVLLWHHMNSPQWQQNMLEPPLVKPEQPKAASAEWLWMFFKLRLLFWNLATVWW